MNRRIAFFALVCLTAVTSLSSPVAAKSPRSYKDVPVPPLVWQPPAFKEFALPNGLSGVVVEDREVPLVNFYLLFPAPPDLVDKVGLADMASWALRNGGSLNIPADSLNEIIEFKAGYLWIGGGDEYVSMWGNCLSEDLPLFLSLTRDLIESPAYPEEKIELHRSTMLEDIRRRNDEPREIASRELSKILYRDHPWGREASEATVHGLTRDEILAYHRLVFRSDGVVIGFSGDVGAAEARDLTAAQFGALKPGSAPIAKLPQANAAPAPGLFYAFKGINQAFISIGHRSISYNDPRRHAADVMNYILGGGGFQSILMQKIRVDAGLTYGVYTDLDTPFGVEGSFRGSASTRLDQAGRTLTLLDEVVRNFAKDGPTREEFDQAREAFVNSFVWRSETSSRVLAMTVYHKWRGLPLDTPQRDLAAYQKLTYEEVVQAAHELIHPDSLVVVVVGNREKLDRPLEDFGTVTTIDLDAGQ